MIDQCCTDQGCPWTAVDAIEMSALCHYSKGDSFQCGRVNWGPEDNEI